MVFNIVSHYQIKTLYYNLLNNTQWLERHGQNAVVNVATDVNVAKKLHVERLKKNVNVPSKILHVEVDVNVR